MAYKIPDCLYQALVAYFTGIPIHIVDTPEWQTPQQRESIKSMEKSLENDFDCEKIEEDEIDKFARL